jgi:hypothetical protein
MTAGSWWRAGRTASCRCAALLLAALLLLLLTLLRVV